MEYVIKFIEEIRKQQLISEYIPNESNLATNSQIEYSEKSLGIPLPKSFKTLVSEYSNGDIYILGAEPLSGVGEMTEDSFAKVDFTYNYLQQTPAKEVIIKPSNKTIKLNQLISFTFGDAKDLGNDHWVFICDKEYPDNEYPVGYISFKTNNIVYTLKNFQEWLQIFWQYNKNEEENFTPVFHTLFPEQFDRDDILNT